MSNIVIILGAGASKDAGAPLMKDFLDTTRDLYSLNNVDNKNNDFQRVFKAINELQRVHSKSNLPYGTFAILIKKLDSLIPKKIFL